ncbi:MAG: DEAD/DEAH box helicase [Prolixibacteraceae bacterium]|jgi:ATP-dependent RNA helicase RhlE|nr:DEAD/DEAH box helicase [Prolixibacteraceae bacterium]
MKLKKLTPELVSAIVEAGFDKEPKPIQTLSMPKIKSGADAYIIAPEGSGKTTALVFGVIQQLKKAEGDAPRAIIMVNSKEKVEEMQRMFETFDKHTDLRFFPVFDQGRILYQKDMIFGGIDILFGTPKRLNELMNTAGFPITQLKMFVVDDCETIYSVQQNHVIHRIGSAIPKAQFLIFANKWIDKFNMLDEQIMKNPSLVEA